MNRLNSLVIALCVGVGQMSWGEEGRRRPRAELETREKGVTELCNEAGDAKYEAVWEKGKVTLRATGKHNTAGYRVFFEPSMLAIYPPEFSLKHQRPTGVVAQVITPFSVQTSFKAQEKPQAITVHDAKGRNQVVVR
jgi:hypothetical protein